MTALSLIHRASYFARPLNAVSRGVDKTALVSKLPACYSKVHHQKCTNMAILPLRVRLQQVLGMEAVKNSNFGTSGQVDALTDGGVSHETQSRTYSKIASEWGLFPRVSSHHTGCVVSAAQPLLGV